MSKSVRIPREKITALIEEAASMPTMQVVVFTGGECFTLGKELDEHVAHASSLRLVTRAVTNGYWAASLDAARRRLDELVAAGLCEINFSTGRFHSSFVPYARVRNGITAAAERGLTVVVNVESCDQSEFDGELAQHPKMVALAKCGRVHFQRATWIEADGESKVTHASGTTRGQTRGGCSVLLNTLTVTPSLSLVACCGLHLEKIHELHLGSLVQSSMIDVLSSRPDDLVKLWLHLDGPDQILQLAAAKLPHAAVDTDAPHPCQSCLALYRSPELRLVVANLAEERRDEILQRYVKSLRIKLQQLSPGAAHVQVVQSPQ